LPDHTCDKILKICGKNYCEIIKFMITRLKEEWPFALDYWKKHWELEE